MRQVHIGDAKNQLTALIQAALEGEDVFIVLNDIQVVRLIPATSGKRSRKAGSAQGLIWIADDFDAPLEDFSEYM